MQLKMSVNEKFNHSKEFNSQTVDNTKLQQDYLDMCKFTEGLFHNKDRFRSEKLKHLSKTILINILTEAFALVLFLICSLRTFSL